MPPPGRAHRETGAAAVEFALVAPLLMLLVFGIVSYGYMLSFRQAMSQGAARARAPGAVWASAYAASQDPQRIAAARAGVEEALSSYGVSCSDGATCTIRIQACGSATCMAVTVSYPYGARPLTPQVPLVPLPDRLSYTATARVQ